MILLLGLIYNCLPVGSPAKEILSFLVILLLVIWLLKVFGLWAYLSHVHI